MPELDTVDLDGVEILSSGGPVIGVGSPPEGDYWTADDLRAMAQADLELGDEIKPPNKIGHSSTQTLLQNSGVKPITPGEMPAAGWVENVRVNDDGTKLLADLKAVPKKVADLIDAGAYRSRSVELSKITSQETGKVYDWVVTGLAWLGGRIPAVRTLDDVVALYEHEGLAGVDARVFVVYAAGDIVWSPTDGYQSLRAAVDEALNGARDLMQEGRWWVMDVTDGRALVGDWQDSESEAWVVPFIRAEDGTVAVAERGEWTPAARAWLERAKQYEDQARRLPGVSDPASDSRPGMPKFTDEQRRKFTEATGLEEAKVTDELLAAAGVSEEEPPKPDGEDEERELEQADFRRELEAVKAEATLAKTEAAKANEELRVEKRRSFVEAALKAGKVTPGQRETLEALYDSNADAARKFVDEAPANDELGREYGSAEEPADDEEAEEQAKAYEADIARIAGVAAEEVI